MNWKRPIKITSFLKCATLGFLSFSKLLIIQWNFKTKVKAQVGMAWAYDSILLLVVWTPSFHQEEKPVNTDSPLPLIQRSADPSFCILCLLLSLSSRQRKGVLWKRLATQHSMWHRRKAFLWTSLSWITLNSKWHLSSSTPRLENHLYPWKGKLNHDKCKEQTSNNFFIENRFFSSCNIPD